jgi:hypothetical protein
MTTTLSAGDRAHIVLRARFHLLPEEESATIPVGRAAI